MDKVKGGRWRGIIDVAIKVNGLRLQLIIDTVVRSSIMMSE